MIIEITICCISGESGTKYCGDQFFRGCFAVRAGNSYEGYVELVSMVVRQLLQCCKHIISKDATLIERVVFIVYYCVCGALSRACIAKALPSKLAPLSAKKIPPGMILRVSVCMKGFKRYNLYSSAISTLGHFM